MTDLAITAMGPDQPGIIAGLAEVAHDHDANVEDATMTALSGHVAVVLQVATDSDPDELLAALRTGTEHLDLTIGVGSATADGPPPPATHLLSVYGPDQPGLLAGVTRAMADADATVVDLTSRMIRDEEPPTWAMSVELVADGDDDGLAGALETVCTRLGVQHTLQRIGAGHD